MEIELLNTGTELLQGRTLNTHQQWLGRELTQLGHQIVRQGTVADTGLAIEQAVSEALRRADGVITTGGLGPTSDDLTRQHIAAMLGVELRVDPAIQARLAGYFRSRNRPVPAKVNVQALVPEGALVLVNEHGTAPGLVMTFPPDRFQSRPTWLAMLPGPPRELHPMFLNQLAPWLAEREPHTARFRCRSLRCTGLGESQVEERIERPLEPLVKTGLEVAYCSRPGEVDIRLSARGPRAHDQVDNAVGIVRTAIGDSLFSEDDTELEAVVIAQLRSVNKTLAIAESCTGGHLGDRLTNVPGASEVFLGGWITYSNASKQRQLNVRPETLAAHGAVSESVAREMAEGARLSAGADYAIAVTGLAGPGGGSKEKPVGTVFLGLAAPDGTRVVPRHNPWDRRTFKHVTTQQALDLLRRNLLESTESPATA